MEKVRWDKWVLRHCIVDLNKSWKKHLLKRLRIRESARGFAVKEKAGFQKHFVRLCKNNRHLFHQKIRQRQNRHESPILVVEFL